MCWRQLCKAFNYRILYGCYAANSHTYYLLVLHHSDSQLIQWGCCSLMANTKFIHCQQAQNRWVLPQLLPHLFNGLFSRTTWLSQYQKGKTSLDLNEARDGGALGCSGISLTICKQCAPHSGQITTPIPHRLDALLTDNQQCQALKADK